MEKSKKEILISQPEEEMIGQRIDRALALVPEIGTRSRAEHLIDNQLVWVNDKFVKSSYKIKLQDQIRIQIPEPESTEIQPFELSLDVLFEDSDVIVINKPAGLVVHPAVGHSQDTLVNALVHHTNSLSMKFGENRPGIVHRLDKDTSGVLVVAKNDFAHESLAQQFKERTTHRVYFALTFGFFPKKMGTFQSFLARHPLDRKKYASIRDENHKIIADKNYESEVGKWAVTHYEVIKTLPDGLSLVKLKLETGRTHQIRVHLSESGHPIVGDALYGAAKKVNQIKSGEIRDLIKSVPRFALHAAELSFMHPKTKQGISFKVNWPEDLSPILKKLGLFHEA